MTKEYDEDSENSTVHGDFKVRDYCHITRNMEVQHIKIVIPMFQNSCCILQTKNVSSIS